MMARCDICPHRCDVEEGHLGRCCARANVNGVVVCDNYGKLTSMALDPIGKKPLARFMPGGMVLSVGSYGCNLRCPFCQNYRVAMARGEETETSLVLPEALVRRALELKPEGNIGIAYTYNEPLIGYEYVLDCARLAREHGLKNVVVTNGFINEAPLRALLPYIDAMNIDLKGFTDGFYKDVGGDLETVKRSIRHVAAVCHVEVTTLIIPGKNDAIEEMDALAAWLASVDDNIPLHISRFFPRYKYEDKLPTPIETLYLLTDVAMRHLKYVYTGNV